MKPSPWGVKPPLNWYDKLFTEMIDGKEFYRVKNYYPMGWPDNPHIEVSESSIAKDTYRDWQERARPWTFGTWQVAVWQEAGKPLSDIGETREKNLAHQMLETSEELMPPR